MALLKQFEYLQIQLQDILSATNNFDEDHRIGEGGFGKIYKAELFLSKEHTTTAIKRLDRKRGQGDSEFWKEVMMLSVYKHENIVSLLGFCDEKDEKILVYKYEPNQSLESHLCNNSLTWVRRLMICIGAARGLAYLHDPGETQQRILHRDIKSANILLDENWNAKITDFGLSKYGPANQKYTFIVSNNIAGTLGYCDPIYFQTGILSKESDIYSFGVVLFEVLCGRLCLGVKDKTESFVQSIRMHYKQNKLDEIIWVNMKDEIHPSSLKVFTTIAFQCLKSDIKKRPLMTKIVTELETALAYQGNSGSPPPGLSDVGSTTSPKQIYSKMQHTIDFSSLELDSNTRDKNDAVGDSRAVPAVSDAGKVDADMALYKELWRACAGPLVTVPRENELVFYFPQAHIEQVEALTNQVAKQQMPMSYNLPSKILCRVVNVQLKAEQETDEVFAEITLMPEADQDETTVKKEPPPPPQSRFQVHSFCKTLTASDTSTHGGFSVLQRHADECLPQLDMSRQPPTQELVAKDLHSTEWRFRHIFGGQPRRHLLQSGWFVSSKRLVAGDTFIFLRGENGELRVGVRRAMRQQPNVPSSVISSHSMHLALGVLATAWHAIHTGTIFTVYYKPRTSPTEFIVPYDQYMESIKNF